MRAKGNGKKQICAANLLRIARGEVAFDRLRGIDTALIDQPNAAEAAAADVEWVLSTYEPRIDVREVRAEALNLGDYIFDGIIKEKKGDGVM